MKGRTRYIGVDCWIEDSDAKRIAKLARKQGIKVLAQFDLAQGVTYLYVPESTFAHDAGIVFNIQSGAA